MPWFNVTLYLALYLFAHLCMKFGISQSLIRSPEQVKDSMRLLGVVKSTSVLSSRLGAGGIAGARLIEEFTAQMRAVSKIALNRRSNLATFLETNGTYVSE